MNTPTLLLATREDTRAPLYLNPRHVVSVRGDDKNNGCYVELVDGGEHRLAHPAAVLADILNNLSDASAAGEAPEPPDCCGFSAQELQHMRHLMDTEAEFRVRVTRAVAEAHIPAYKTAPKLTGFWAAPQEPLLDALPLPDDIEAGMVANDVTTLVVEYKSVATDQAPHGRDLEVVVELRSSYKSVNLNKGDVEIQVLGLRAQKWAETAHAAHIPLLHAYVEYHSEDGNGDGSHTIIYEQPVGLLTQVNTHAKGSVTIKDIPWPTSAGSN